jgi:hypothetical protein
MRSDDHDLHEPAVEELKRIWPLLSAARLVRGESGPSLGIAIRSLPRFKEMESGDEVIKYLLQELIINPNTYRMTYLREWCSLPDEEEYKQGGFAELSVRLRTAILKQEETIIARTRGLLKTEGIADPFLFHALMEITRKPVSLLITPEDGKTYVDQMWTHAHRQEGIFVAEMIVIHYDDRTGKYRLMVEKKKGVGINDRNGMSSILTIPTQQFLYGETYEKDPRNRSTAKKADHSMYQVTLRATPAGMEVEVDGESLLAYSPETIAHVLQETELQREAGVSTNVQVQLRQDGEDDDA